MMAKDLVWVQNILIKSKPKRSNYKGGDYISARNCWVNTVNEFADSLQDRVKDLDKSAFCSGCGCEYSNNVIGPYPLGVVNAQESVGDEQGD